MIVWIEDLRMWSGDGRMVNEVWVGVGEGELMGVVGESGSGKRVVWEGIGQVVAGKVQV
ncbi:hypothetical protein [Paenibacillus xylanexedens]|uniref:hypothetical protein n=1 Tax=Paenibacillus xylanexedens TaxID=528191 RepID=UPI00164302A3|nr:hypothetical protein [Paenibacillus xylanexedens]